VWVPDEANVLVTIATAAAVPPSIARVMWTLRRCFFLLNYEFTTEEFKLRAATRQWFSTSRMHYPAAVKKYLIKKWSYGCCGRVSWLLVHGQQLPWLLWPEHLIVITQAMFSRDPPCTVHAHGLVTLALQVLFYWTSLFSETRDFAHKCVLCTLPSRFFVLWPRLTLNVSLSSPIRESP
jgi:hypothetical protein